MMILGPRGLLAKVQHAAKPKPPAQLHSKEITREVSTGQKGVLVWASFRSSYRDK